MEKKVKSINKKFEIGASLLMKPIEHIGQLVGQAIVLVRWMITNISKTSCHPFFQLFYLDGLIINRMFNYKKAVCYWLFIIFLNLRWLPLKTATHMSIRHSFGSVINLLPPRDRHFICVHLATDLNHQFTDHGTKQKGEFPSLIVNPQHRVKNGPWNVYSCTYAQGIEKKGLWIEKIRGMTSRFNVIMVDKSIEQLVIKS